ncbi:hypothetical protein L9F63_000541, partial [Diploptera punctata]
CDLLPLKGQYFLWNAGTAPIVPFMPVYARQLGFSSVIVGTIYTVLPISGMLAKPLFGAVADHFQLQKMLFLAFQILTAISFFVIQFIPEILAESVVKMDCDALTYFKSCNEGVDSCAVHRLITDAGNQTVLCEPDEWFMHEICTLWKSPLYCKPISHMMNLVQFEAYVPLSHTELFRCFHTCQFFLLPREEEVVLPSDITPVNNSNNVRRAPCSVRCNNAAMNEVLQKSVVTDGNVASFYQFWVFFLLMIISWVSMAVVVSVGDTICFEMLGDKASRFGQQRMWGAVGWGIFAVITGLLVDEISKGKQQKDYTVMFYLMAAMLILDVVVSSKLKHSQTKLSTSIIRDVGKLLTEVRIVVFMLWCIAVGLCTGLQWNFLFWHLEDLAVSEGCNMLQWIKTIEGLVMGVQCFGGELPFLFLSGRILKKIGHIHAMSLVLLAFGLRFIIYSVLQDPWWCLPVELFQGFTFGIFYATMASYASVVAPPGTEATVQGTVGAVFEGIGVSLGSLFGGMIYDEVGGAATFRNYGIFSLVLFVAHVLIQFLIGRKSSHSEQARGPDYESAARYAAPNEALQMMDDLQELTPS